MVNIKRNDTPAAADMCVWSSHEFTYTFLEVALQPDTGMQYLYFC